ncbi:MAG: polysaccharide biosynthesis tyrosine autokinase, partial [Flavobacteriaceae bacterium]|nr:polysaccharide biosynthesis tyrosine autokinase [Flavobacteriaceae bacterium]
AKNTDIFINNRIEDISVELTNLDKGVETYKTENKLSDMASEAGLVLESNAELTNRIVDLTSQIKLIDYLIKYMKTNKDDLIPSNLGMLNESAGLNTETYNRLLLERDRLLRGANASNPIVINLNDQIAQLRESIDQSLRNSKSSLAIALNEARIQENRLDTKISSAPKKEREIRDIQRQQQIIETLYLYLLQKREENSISLAVTAPNAKIIDRAYGSDIPVSPKKMIVYIVALILGFIVPFMIIYIRMLLDNKIHALEDVEGVVKAPILGDIPTTKSEKKVIISEQDRSNVAESFRLLRTNVNFMLPRDLNEGKTIFITSTIGGEGKTFIAINLASALALLNKKVLLIGADIRKPKIATYLKTKQEKGLTHYLIDSSLKVKDVIVPHKETNLDVLESGVIPPNPSELLTNGRFDQVIAYGKTNYDYIIIDTAPVNIVTDTLLLGHHADLFVFVIRANFLDKRLLKIPKTMYENKRLPNMAILINDTNYEKRGYGYGYGYGYGEPQSKRALWKKVFNI